MNWITRIGGSLFLASLLGCSAPVGDGKEALPREGNPPERGAHSTGNTSSNSGTLFLQVKGLRNQKGRLGISLFRSAEGFPGDAKKAYRRSWQQIGSDSVDMNLEGVPFGEYAVAVLHDEDLDGVLGRGLFGIPTEGAGKSNNPTPRFGPPRYEDARFTLSSKKLALEITIRYPD